MTREDVLAVARKAGDVGTVTHEEFADYIVMLEAQRRIGDDWQTVDQPYMAVDGKLAMANEDHRKQGKRLDFGEPKVLINNEDQLTLLVTVTSEIYGTRHGIATSRKQNGTRAEREFPWEVAETSAIGRALTAMGYGLLPGAGLASAEDMLRAGSTTQTGGNGGSVDKEGREYPRRTAPMSNNQRNKLIELYIERFGGAEAEALQGLDAVFESAFKHTMAEATLAEASKIISQMISAKTAGAPKSAVKK
ncbi:MAG: hypothetical protein HY782_12630 [Chloroflexi bacterium]|nr:hypothetical protein [Chloroflexota bacterium]